MTYREAGVDLAGAERHVAEIAEAVVSSWTEGVVGRFGGFAAGVRLPAGMRSPILMMSTDGVGTKLELARRTGLWDGVGFDLVAMCVDDLVTAGARPLGFVDYIAVGALDPARDAAIVASIARACAEAGCPLLGGETAEHPGVMQAHALDLAGAVMGVVEEDELLGPDRVEAGDLVVGLRSPNPRSNGFSLIRRLFDREDWGRFLEPSVIYGPSILASRSLVKSGAHITGGGLPENVMRAVGPDNGVQIDTGSWQPPEVFSLIASKGVEREEMFSTFNMGIGFCVFVDPHNADEVVANLTGHQARVIGRVTPHSGFELL